MLNTTSSQSLLAQIKDPDYWRSINPSLSVSEAWTEKPPDAIAFDPDDLDSLRQDLQTEGYFQLDAILPEAEIFRMAIGVETLYELDIMTPFAYVYDEFWRITQRLSVLLSAILGDDYQQLPAIWAWRIDTSNNDGGWSPHRDRTFNTLRPDGMPNIVTVWIPLSDAIPLNGCMYVLPAHLDPNYRGDLKSFSLPGLQEIRALPAAAGSVLGWSHALLHWGSRSSHKAPFPRISMSCEFQRRDVDLFQSFSLPLRTLPTFSQRLQVIGMALSNYKHMYSLSPEFSEVADELTQLR